MKIYLVIKNKFCLDPDDNPQCCPCVWEAYAEKSTAIERTKAFVDELVAEREGYEMLDIEECLEEDGLLDEYVVLSEANMVGGTTKEKGKEISKEEVKAELLKLIELIKKL